MPKIESPAELLDLAVGFQKSHTLFTFVELEIAKILEKKSLKSSEIARRLKIDKLAMERFLNACVSIGLLVKKKDLFANTKLTENFLIKGTEFYLGGQMQRYQNRSAPQWTNLTKHLKNWKYGETEAQPDDEDQGSQAMAEQHNLALLHGFALAEAFDFTKYKKLLDLGGGTGASSIALCKSYPKLDSIVFDLPENTKIADKFIKKEKLQKQIEAIGGDFKKNDLPDDFDAVLLANFMAVADEKDNQLLLEKVYEKLPVGGICILSGWILDRSHFAPQISTLFCLEDICWNAPDVERDEKIYTEWLKKAGFKSIECKTYLEPTKILYGFKK
jgi:3-hydroxy-5-methyl-1-naphthoate 3-O-methyltransferase